MVLLAFLAVVLFALAVGLGYSALRAPGQRRRENLEQIESYGYGPADSGASGRTRRLQATLAGLDRFANALGASAAARIRILGEEATQRDLYAAGLFGLTARRFLGYRLLLSVALPAALVLLLAASGASTAGLFLLGITVALIAWIAPSFLVHRRARTRLQAIDDAFPELIDLLVVTLEAGVGFSAALRLSAERLDGPLGDEVRLTLQEQSLGLTMTAAFESGPSAARRPPCARSSVHSFRASASASRSARSSAIRRSRRAPGARVRSRSGRRRPR